MEVVFYQENRKRLLEKMQEINCLTVLSSGYELTKSADENYPFQVNTNFYYLTGISQAEVHLVLRKSGENKKAFLFIDPFDERYAQWVGHKLTKEEAARISGIDVEDILYTTDFKSTLDAWMQDVEAVYLDLEKNTNVNFNSFGLTLQTELTEKGYTVKNIYDDIIRMRMVKQPCEVEALKKAIDVTGQGIEALMRNAKPGMYEYQLEAYFDFVIKTQGNHKFSFKTIAASGGNATTLHYSTNHCVIGEDDLILFDLGCKEEEYCADITRTFPINGKITPLQKTIYQIVLDANKAVGAQAKAGMSIAELQRLCIDILTEGCLKAGLFTDPADIKKYYMHSISHSIGLDTHDPEFREEPLPVGAVISNEPGLYFPEHHIGIRIEDDLWLQEDGAINLSAQIIKEIDDIENFMANR